VTVRVKICGLTRLEDALAACELGADALGFVFHPPSPRYVSPEEVREIVSSLPPLVATVGVAVDLPAGEVERLVEVSGVDRVQLSGEESPEYCRTLAVPWFKAIKIGRREDLERIKTYGRGGTYLLDTLAPGLAGGSGRSFDWAWAAEANRYGRIILAGGLGPANVRRAIETARPYAVDVAGGVESRPGVKDHEKLAAFIAAAKSG